MLCLGLRTGEEESVLEGTLMMCPRRGCVCEWDREKEDKGGHGFSSMLVDFQAHLIHSKVEDCLHHISSRLGDSISRSERTSFTVRMERSLKRDKSVLSFPASEHGVSSGSQSWGPAAALKAHELTDRQTDFWAGAS